MLRRRVLNPLCYILGAALSGALLSAAHPPREFSWVGWIALIPLFIAICTQRPVYSFFLSYLCGLVFFPLVFNWIFQVSGYTYLHHVILDAYLGAYFALFGVTVAFISKRRGAALALAAAPFIWVCLEYVRSNLSFLSLPWALLGHTQYQNTVMIQAASLAGVYSVSFVIVLTNAAATLLLLYFRPLNYLIGHRKIPHQHLMMMASATTALVAVVALFGVRTMSRPLDGPTLKIAVAQGSIEQGKKWDPEFAQTIMQTYADLTHRAAQEKPDLIIWPETATPAAIRGNRQLFNQVSQIARSSGTHILLGSSEYPKMYKMDSDKPKYRNSALLFLPTGNAAKQYYDKIFLMPFGEFLPYADLLPWSWINVSSRGNFLAGKNFTIFNLGDYRFATTICWENIFPGPPRTFVDKGAQFIVNLVNEAWFGDSAAPYQFLSMSVFRAIENRRYIVRCANTGISCFIDPYGYIVKRVRDESGKDTFVRGTATESITPVSSKTIYTRFGDWFVAVCFCIAFVIFVWAMQQKRY